MFGQVLEIIDLTPRMKRIVFGGDGLDEFEPCEFSDQYVNVLIPPADAPYSVPFDTSTPLTPRPVGRRYTIRSWDAETRQMTIDFVLHGEVGTTGRWANSAKVGDLMQFTGPSGGYAPTSDADWYLMAGDESALPAIAASLEIVPAGARTIVVILVDNAEHELELSSPGDVTITWLHREDHAESGERFAQTIRDLSFPEGIASVFVHGEASEVRAIRKHLLGERRIPKEQTSISPYWRRNFTDEKWREVKREWLAEVALDI